MASQETTRIGENATCSERRTDGNTGTNAVANAPANKKAEERRRGEDAERG
jgi:hypothetical protein